MSGLSWTEGPLFSVRGDIVVGSLDQGTVVRIGPGGVSTPLLAGGSVNGIAEDGSGRLLLAQAGELAAQPGGFPGTRHAIGGGVQCVSEDGRVVWITQDPIAPNDICFGPDGMLYVTDPTRNRRERDDGRIWRVDPQSGTARILASVSWYPNGIGFGPDDDLYVTSTGDGRVVRFDVSGDRIAEGASFIEVTSGGPDGFAFDNDGNLIVCCVGEAGRAGHVEVWTPERRLLETIEPGPNRYYTNVAIDADARLILTDTRADGGVLVYDGWRAGGLPLYPFRAATV